MVLKSEGVNSSKNKPERRGHWESMQEVGPRDRLTGKLYPPPKYLLPASSLSRTGAGERGILREPSKRLSYKIT